MAKTYHNLAWQRAVIALSSTVICTIIIAALYMAQAVFVPLALAIFLTFLLTPYVLALQKRGLGRLVSVLTAVLTAGLLLGGSVWLVSLELADLAGELPSYSQNIRSKIKSLRDLGEGSVLNKLKHMMNEIGLELGTSSRSGEADPAGQPIQVVPEPIPATVVVQPASTPWIAHVQALVGPVFEILGQLALASILVVFMLLNREDLRDRMIRLAGDGRITITTKAIDDTAQRISRFLLMQVIVNGTYGLALALGLLVLGVPYALLWGFLAAILRYVPYVGAWIAAVLPIGLSIAMFESWWQPLTVIGFFIILELVSNNLMEPWLYGQSIGVSEVAFLVAAAIWTFLWGPVGLVLSAPLTVCLAVLGKFVPQLEFLDVLLSDQPALEPSVRYYQRALARDQDEATDIVLEQATELPIEQIFDDVLIPALTNARRDRELDNITETDESYLRRITQELVEEFESLAQKESATPLQEGPVRMAQTDADRPVISVLGYAARDESEEVALLMLQHLLPGDRWDMEIIPAKVLSSELLVHIEKHRPAVVCVASLPPGGLAHTRYLVKRLQARSPATKIIIGRWGLKGNLEHNRQSLQQAGADAVGVSLQETRDQLASWLPVFSAQVQNHTVQKDTLLVPAG